MDSVGEGEGGKILENGTETCKISCMKRDASPGSMHHTGCLGLVNWDDPEGWYGEGGGRGCQDAVSQLFVTPWTVAYQAPRSMGFSGKNTGVGISFSRGCSR